mmetsp:Transcript_4406/g.3692  ORF Transcript_4406/g.3692 Transcript_4406/m.3692 type:complete len:111 (-) Transcript_4406:662-994(-)
MNKQRKEKTVQLKSFSSRPIQKLNTRYGNPISTERFGSTSTNMFASKNSSNLFQNSQEVPTFRITKQNDPRVKSLSIDKIGAIDKKHKYNVALRKTNQRLLKNVDFNLLK